MTDFTIVNPLEQPGWDDRLLPHADASFFHTAAWASVLHETYGYRPRYLTAAAPGGELELLVPLMEVRSRLTGRRAVSLPFTDFCPAILPAGSFRSALTALARLGEEGGWKSIELRNGQALPGNPAHSCRFFGHTLDLSPGEAQVERGFRSSTKRNIKAAARAGVTVELALSLDGVKEFYKLNCLTRKRHGLPPQPIALFESIYRQVLARGAGMLALGRHEGRAIAGAMFFHHGKKAIYKYGASDLAQQHLRANNAVMCEGIRSYARRGFESFCFGITEVEHDGLRQFKLGWGATERTIDYYKYDLREKRFVTSKTRVQGFHNAIFRNTPIPLLRVVGAMMYGHMG